MALSAFIKSEMYRSLEGDEKQHCNKYPFFIMGINNCANL
jgi:hypothetical protein